MPLASLLWLAELLFRWLVLPVLALSAWNGLRASFGVGWARQWSRRRPASPQQAILITGATSGIGLALAKHLFASGYSVLAAYYNANEPGHAELQRLDSLKASSGPKPRMLLVELDVRDQASLARARQQVEQLLLQHKLQLAGLVNNAGLGSLQPFAWLQRKNIKNIIDTNLLGSLLTTREFLPLLANAQPPGRIVNVSSGLGLVPGANYATYGLTKAALIYFTRCLNLELSGSLGVRAVVVIPHNFIKNTNICAHNLAQNRAAWEELGELERSLYKRHFDHHCELSAGLEAATKVTMAAQTAHTAAKAKQPLPAGPCRKWLGLTSDVWRQMRGLNESASIEESGALECFVEALQLVEPCEHMFAGEPAFRWLVGSALLALPSCWLSWLGPAVSGSLYR